ncbi:MAG TPA: PBP1A family penicillin-binding protein [Myxococcaceae bacterium]|nr:PBP1A family penicillin-binding protein [Myxococcaceae bacterium]
MEPSPRIETTPSPTSPAHLPPPQEQRTSLARKLWRWTKRLALALLALIVFIAGLAAAVFAYFDRDLPSVEALRSYKPPQVTKVYCADGSVCAEFFKERRTLVSIKSLPAQVKNAFLAAEDADFYQHEGLDYLGMFRAAVKSLQPGARFTGASTITQQACRNILLTQERTLSRKIKEWILTPRMEKALSKDQILDLYLNQINFGHGRYGIEEAALYYFGKHAKELSVGEAATLAGTVQLPERINPVTNMVRAKRRQRYVLGQMAKHEFLPAPLAAKEMEKPIALAPRPPAPVGPYYAEEIRRMAVARYGNEAVLAGGMRLDIAMQPKLQAAADEALKSGLEALDRRMGYRGPLGTLAADRFSSLRPIIAKRIEEAGKRQSEEVLVADLSRLAEGAKPPATKTEEEEGAEGAADVAVEGEAPPSADEVVASSVSLKPLKEGLRLAGLVKKVDDAGKRAEIDLVARTAQVFFSSVGWARPRGVGKWTPNPTKMSDVLKPGDIVLVRIVKLAAPPAPLEANLDQLPEVQGGLVSIDPTSRRVVAISGGYDFELSSFNRATQALRQPGSSFKPFLYAAAIASQKFTALSVVNDAPEAIRDPYTGKMWKPHNYERSGFEGPLTLRQALTRSKNTVSVRLIEALTPPVVIDFARRAGIHSALPDNLTLALGTGEVTMMEIANAYATLQSLGTYAEPITVIRATDAHGTVLEEHQATFEETIPPAVAFVVTSLMRSVVEEGTAAAVRELNRPAAGKTGTANEFRDAWFSGYTTDLVASAWVGFDNHDSLGNGETGARAALPIWLSYMKAAHRDIPERDFPVPPGVTFVRIDPASGLLAGAAIPGRTEPFLEGTAPTAEAPPPGQVDPNRFLLEDRRRGGL